MLPNFLAHIVIYGLAGYYTRENVVAYLQEAIEAYQEFEKIDEEMFCQYLAMEVLHRMNGKWIEGITTAEQKVTLAKFSLNIFDKKIQSLLTLYKEIE